MKATLVAGLPWLLSALTIGIAANQHRDARLAGIVGVALWLVWIGVAEAWGLFPATLALFVYGRDRLARPTPRDAVGRT